MSEEMIYMIHGFASGPKYPNEKAAVFEKVFGLPVKQIVYDSAATFAENIVALRKQIESTPKIIIGTSLGAFYASKLAEDYAGQVRLLLLLNPCHTPSDILKHAVGAHESFATGESFVFTEHALQSYAKEAFVNPKLCLNRQVMLNMDDDLIDSQRTIDLFADVLDITSFEIGGHRFENIGSNEVMDALKNMKAGMKP